MKEITKEFAKDCGHVTVEFAKYCVESSVLGSGGMLVTYDVLAIVYSLACKALKCTPEGRALDIASKVILCGSVIGGAVLGSHISYKLDTAAGLMDAIGDMTAKYSKDSTIPNKFKFEVVIPQ